MDFPDWFMGLALGPLLDSLLVDFTLAFAFFLALCFAILGRHFERQRSAAAMSVVLALSLSIGLVWWEFMHGLSVRDLGPIALWLILSVLALVVFESIRRVAGLWAGSGIAVATAIMLVWLLGLGNAAPAAAFSMLFVFALAVGVAALLLHRGNLPAVSSQPAFDAATMRRDVRNLNQDRVLSDRVAAGLCSVRRQADLLYERPEQAGDIMFQLQRLLPDEGALTERLARLRAIAHRVRAGHVAKIEELRSVVARLPPERRRAFAEELARRYQQLNLDTRLERLDRVVAENERRVADLTRQAQVWLADRNYRQLSRVLDMAARLQRQNAQLMRVIERSEARLLTAARDIQAREPEVASD